MVTGSSDVAVESLCAAPLLEAATGIVFSAGCWLFGPDAAEGTGVVGSALGAASFAAGVSAVALVQLCEDTCPALTVLDVVAAAGVASLFSLD
jgi:hypothetical protein